MSLVELKGALLSLSSTADDGLWVVADLVEKASGKPFNEYWRYRSGRLVPRPLPPSHLPSPGGGSPGSGSGGEEHREQSGSLGTRSSGGLSSRGLSGDKALCEVQQQKSDRNRYLKKYIYTCVS